MFARLISQCGVQAVHPIFDERIAVGIPVRDLESSSKFRQAGSDDLPVGLGARALPALAGRVAIYLEFLSGVKHPGFDAPQKHLTGRRGIGMRQHYLVQYMDDSAEQLYDDRAHRIHVKVQQPENRRSGMKLQRSQIRLPVKGIIDTTASQMLEACLELLPVSAFIEFARDC